MTMGRGFTLVELMVVLAILGFIAVIAVPGVLRSFPGAELRASAYELASGLRQARGLAIAGNAEVAFTLDGDGRRYAIGTGDGGAALKEGIDISLVTAQSEVSGRAQGSIRFFPDGSSTGGRIELKKGERATAIEVDWLTGRVSTVE